MDIGTIAAGRVIPRDNEQEAFVAVSMYARPLTVIPRQLGCRSDASAHRISSDLSAFIGHSDPTKQILAASDMFYGAIGSRLSLAEIAARCGRMQALGLEFLGRRTVGAQELCQTTYRRTRGTCGLTAGAQGSGPETAVNQLDYAFASRGFHEKVSVLAMNEIEEWGPIDHCRLMIEVKVRGHKSFWTAVLRAGRDPVVCQNSALLK